MAYNLAFLDCLLASDMKQGIQFLYSGLIPLLIDGYDQIIIIDGRDYPLRSVAEPSKEKSLRGAKDGFVEAMMMNIALLRRRDRDNALIFKIYTVGDVTKTDVALAYMKDRADQDIGEENGSDTEAASFAGADGHRTDSGGGFDRKKA